MTITATVKGGFWSQYGGTFALIKGTSVLRKRIAQMFSHLAVQRELGLTLDGVAAGSAASATHTRVANSTELGGKRVVETVTDISRNSAAADITQINLDYFTFGGVDVTPILNGDRNPLGTR